MRYAITVAYGYSMAVFVKFALAMWCILIETQFPLCCRLKEENQICVSTDGPWESVLKFKPPMCFSMEDAELVVQCIDRILTG